MSYQVTARKWRPQTFEEIVGQETVTQTLQNALTSGRIAHAFLFSGVRGVGKTTAARILAKALNCQEEITPNPCGECVSCEEIREGNCVDVQEIDAASNRGIDSIRELRDSVRYGTARDRFKIFIIDEVHMLTNEAFNALLKTLEEPPAHVKFIMATTELHKIPPTILSRCQKYEFKPIPFSAIFDRLKFITSREGVEISDYALSTLASVAQGSMRDGQSALDQILAFSGSKVQDADIKALLGVVDQRVVVDLFNVVAAADRGSLLTRVHELMSGGIAPQILCLRLVEHVRNLMVCRAVGWDESLLQLPDSEKADLEDQASKFADVDLIRFYDILSQTGNELRWHSQPAVHLEITLLKLIELEGLRSIEEVIGRLEGGGGLPSPSKGREAGRSLPGAPRISRPVPANAAPGQTAAAKPATQKSVVSTDGPKQESGDLRSLERSASPELAEAAVAEGASEPVSRLMTSLKEEFMGLYTQLQFASEIAYVDGKLKISFPATGKFHAEIVEGQDNRRRLSETFATIIGAQPKIDIVLDAAEEEKQERVDPRNDPKVKAFLTKFPGRVTVKREFED